MSDENGPSSTPVYSQRKIQASLRKPRFVGIRGWLRSRSGRVVVPLISLLLGIVLGLAAVFLFGESGVGPIDIVPVSGRGDIIVEVDRTFITQLVRKNLISSGMPGQIQNINVNLVQGSQMIVSGEDEFSILGLQLIRPFTFTVQLYTNSCFLKIHIVKADFSNIPVTRLVQNFESQINHQLRQSPSGLPSGFQYCTTSVRTEPAGMFVTYMAIPVSGK